VGAVAGCPAVDTMKQVDGDGRIVDTPDRATLWHAQTPQVFPAEILRRAYAVEGADGTDDAALVERVGGTVRMVDAGPWNIKVTHPEDVVVAGAVLMRRFETAP
jgi:2-C-methyl-D-erythritol 4-phosphate cytidylyltransferase